MLLKQFNSLTCGRNFYKLVILHQNSISKRLVHSETKRLPLSYVDYNENSKTTSSDEPIFMTHGLLGGKQNWNSIAKAVSKSTNRRVITYDARNHGDSPHDCDMSYEAMVQDLLGLCDHLKINKFSFLGHSMGGRTACCLALLFPERVEKLIVVDISPLTIGGDFDQMQRFIETMKSINYESNLTLSEARKKTELILQPVVQDPAVRAFLLTNLTKNEKGIHWKPNIPILLDKLGEIKKFPSHLLHSQCSSPALFIRGGNSPYVPQSDFGGIKKLFPNVSFETIEKSGHWPQAENPTQFIQVLVSFLNKKT